MRWIEMPDEARAKLVKELYGCTNELSVETIFSQNEIDDPADRSTVLRECMSVESKFHAPGDDLSPADEYEMDLFAFVEGTWRLL